MSNMKNRYILNQIFVSDIEIFSFIYIVSLFEIFFYQNNSKLDLYHFGKFLNSSGELNGLKDFVRSRALNCLKPF